MNARPHFSHGAARFPNRAGPFEGSFDRGWVVLRPSGRSLNPTHDGRPSSERERKSSVVILLPGLLDEGNRQSETAGDLDARGMENGGLFADGRWSRFVYRPARGRRGVE